MKYAFVFASNVFISGERTISYADNDGRVDFLKVLSFYQHHTTSADNVLRIDADISTSDDLNIAIRNNRIEGLAGLDLRASDRHLQLYRTGHEEPILDIVQLDEHEYRGLSSHIVNEIDAQHAHPIIKIRGDFRVKGHRIVIDGEKLFVDGEAFANGVTNAHEGVALMANETLY